MVLFHGVTCEQPPTGYVRVSIVVWFWGHRSHVVKRIYPSRSGVDGPDAARARDQRALRRAGPAVKARERRQRARPSALPSPNDILWDAQFARLEAYKAVHGDCNVPWRWVEDKALAKWVNSQRRAKKTFDRDGSGTTPSRVARLTELGFVWAPEDIVWDAQFARLEAYKAAHGDCDVPERWVEDQALANWVRKQRRAREHARGESHRALLIRQ